MDNQELSQLTDEELLEEAKKLKSFSMTNAFLIGFLMAIVVYSVVKHNFGFVMVIPLYFVYKMINDPKNKRVQALEKLLRERKLK